MPKICLAFDLGASSGRAITGKIVDGVLTLREVHRFRNFPEERSGHLFWNLERLFREIKTGIAKACAAESAPIESLSVDTWGVDYAFFRDGIPVRDPYCYRDSRTADIPERVHRIVSEEEMYSICGIQEMPFNTIYQLFAHKESHPEDFLHASRLLFMPDALLYLLCGDLSCEYSIASTGAMLDARTGQWCLPLLERLGIPVSILPPLKRPLSASLPLRKEICDELGIPPISVVKVPSHDTASAVAALPVRDDSLNCAYLSTGTWALLGTELKRPCLSESARIAHFTNEGGIGESIRFLTNIAGTWLLQETRRTWMEAGHDISFPEMSRLADETGPVPFRVDPNAPEFLSPGDMPERIRAGCIASGQGVPESEGELLRCIYDSLADCFFNKLKELEKLLNLKFDVLHVLGGATRDPLLMRLTASAVGIPVTAGPVEATAAGNLLSQLMAAGELSSLSEARKLLVSSFGIETWLPDAGKK